jgi:hypothetical protein
MIQDPQGGTGGVPSPDGPRYVMPNFRQELLGKLLPEEATSRRREPQTEDGGEYRTSH